MFSWKPIESKANSFELTLFLRPSKASEYNEVRFSGNRKEMAGLLGET